VQISANIGLAWAVVAGPVGDSRIHFAERRQDERNEAELVVGAAM